MTVCEQTEVKPIARPASSRRRIGIRTDPSGSVTCGLRRQITAATDLLVRARTVAELGEFIGWRAELDRWQAASTLVVRYGFASEAVQELCRSRPGTREVGWVACLRTDVRALQDMHEFLITLCATLTRPGPKPGPAVERTRDFSQGGAVASLADAA